MGCPKDKDFRYRELLVCDWTEQTIDFAGRNRRLTKIWTLGGRIAVAFDPDQVTFSGPKGAELLVEFTLG